MTDSIRLWNRECKSSPVHQLLIQRFEYLFRKKTLFVDKYFVSKSGISVAKIIL